MVSGVPVTSRPSPCREVGPRPPAGSFDPWPWKAFLRLASRTVIFAWVPWLNPPHLDPPFSFPLGTVGRFPRLSYPIRFSLGIGTFGFSAGWILVSILFVTHVNILTSDRTSVSRNSASHGTGSLADFLSRCTERSTTFRRLGSTDPFSAEITASVSDLVSCISGASSLILYVVTRFFTDGCFQAHRQVVFGLSLPFALSLNLETLSVDLGCFPLNVQYLSTAVGLRSWLMQVYSQFTPDRYSLTCPHWYRALPPCIFERALLKQLS